MHIRPLARTARRAALAGAAAVTATLALSVPASAHAEVEADTPQALATDVTLTFVSEAESASGGFTKVRVVLPEGIAPGDVTLDGAPEGWKLTAAGDGYTLGGPALKPGVDAEHRIKVKQLPNAKELVFKTVETYSDGEVSRWIETPTGGKEPEQPAPVLKLKAAAPGATPLSPEAGATAPAGSAPDAPSATAASSAPVADTAGAEQDHGPSTGLVVGAAVLALVVLGGGGWVLARRRSSPSPQD
ncbi:DUF1775 domain-containing protein [Streptomyces sediminimaris]|uniref:DUF1775 domain-containing protein n=1 Tax=Streptomyces sediminimaris TaxID=3383721 RepID=UPI00399A6296